MADDNIIRESRPCPAPGCGKPSTVLTVADGSEMVTWCDAGHVTVFEDNYTKQVKRLVYTFGEV